MPRYETDEKKDLIDKLFKDIRNLELKNFEYLVEIESLKNTVEQLRNITSANNLKTFGN